MDFTFIHQSEYIRCNFYEHEFIWCLPTAVRCLKPLSLIRFILNSHHAVWYKWCWNLLLTEKAITVLLQREQEHSTVSRDCKFYLHWTVFAQHGNLNSLMLCGREHLIKVSTDVRKRDRWNGDCEVRMGVGKQKLERIFENSFTACMWHATQRQIKIFKQRKAMQLCTKHEGNAHSRIDRLSAPLCILGTTEQSEHP